MPELPLPIGPLRSRIPWWVKMMAKLSLVAVPIRHATLRRLGLTRHGDMETPECALETFLRHFDYTKSEMPQAFTVLELGPGDSLFTVLIAKGLGAGRCYVVDVAPMASRDILLYREMTSFLRAQGLPAQDIAKSSKVEEILTACDGVYMTNGLASLRDIPTGQVDFLFSNSVLQHIHLAELPATLAELRRILKPLGVSVHSLDLRDMMGQSLHHLKFSAQVWESSFFHRAAFYTNRLRHRQMITALENANFKVTVTEENLWPQLPVSRRLLASPFREMRDDELRVATSVLIARPS